MGASELKVNISRILQSVNDERFLKSVFVMLKEYSVEQSSLSEEQLAELSLRVKKHDEGKTETQPWKASLDAIKRELGK
jgi:predicted amino acid-binding ACT domain protein